MEVGDSRLTPVGDRTSDSLSGEVEYCSSTRDFGGVHLVNDRDTRNLFRTGKTFGVKGDFLSCTN